MLAAAQLFLILLAAGSTNLNHEVLGVLSVLQHGVNLAGIVRVRHVKNYMVAMQLKPVKYQGRVC